MSFLRPLTLGSFVILLAGCAGTPAPSVKTVGQVAEPALKEVVPVSGASSAAFPSALHDLGIDLDQLTRLIQREPATPQTLVPEQAYGVWMLESGPRRTWIRIERPKISIMGVNRDTDQTWALDGDYSVARDGTVFGIMTGQEQAAGPKERTLAVWTGEEGIQRRRQPKEVPPLPYCCRMHPAGDTLTIEPLCGGCFGPERQPFFQGRFQKTSLGRPAHLKAPAPMGAWERETRDLKARVTLHILAGRFDLTIVDRVTGQRLHLEGEYDMTAAALFYGVITALEVSGGAHSVSGPIMPQPLSIRFGWYGSALQILEVHSLCLNDTTHQALAATYNPQGRK